MKSARKAKDKLHKACERASETRERTLHRQEQNRMRMASMRKSDEVLRRKQSNKEAMASKRKRNVSVEHAILSFHHDIKNGPDFVCTSCHRMMYRKSVVP